MNGWLYVLELQPMGYVKVGRSVSIASRISSHVVAARLAGGQVARMFAAQCADIEAGERNLLNSIMRMQGAQLVAGREVFAGVTFAQAVTAANELSDEGGRFGSVVAPQPELVADILAAMGGEVAMHIAELLPRLVRARPGVYGSLSVHDLGRALRRAGVPVGQMKVRGRNRTGIRSATLLVAA